jgi:hypothetical protein
MRKQNLSIYDIERFLKDHDSPLSCTAIWEILHDEGLARLPRREDQDRPDSNRTTAAAVADRREFSLQPRKFQTQLGGLFLLLPFLVRCDFPELGPQGRISRYQNDPGPAGSAVDACPQTLLHRT